MRVRTMCEILFRFACRNRLSYLRLLCSMFGLLMCLFAGDSYCWQEEYEFVMEWGSAGSDTGQFNTPLGMGIDRNGHIYVCEMGNDRVQKFDSLGNFMLMFGSSGTGPGQFLCPRDVAIDDSGFIYVSDPCNCRIQKFDSSGSFVLAWGDTGAAPGEFEYCDGIAVDSSDYIDVADRVNGRIQKFDRMGNFVFQWFLKPDSSNFAATALAVGEGRVYVYNLSNPANIVCFDLAGNFILEWGGWGFAPSQFRLVEDLAADGTGDIYATDIWNRRVQKSDSSGKFITVWGTSGGGIGEFIDPYGVVVDSYGFVYVSDASRNRVLKFQKAN